MRVISRKKLRDFWETSVGAASETSLQVWYRTVAVADWKKWADVRADFPSADLVGDCVIFDIRGNLFRLIARIRYKSHKVFVLKVMPHKEYDKRKWLDECGCRDKPPAAKPKNPR
jgi:mRNA interferase HigB